MGAGYAMRNCVKPCGSLDTQNTRLLDYVDVTDDSEMPIIHDTLLSPPAEIMIWEGRPRLYAGKFVHLYTEDYRFEQLWRRPEFYLPKIQAFAGIFSPDFSLFRDWNIHVQRNNVYRSRLLGAYWQANGIPVIPIVSWAGPKTYSFCFDGIPEGSMVAVSTVGVHREREARAMFKAGLKEMLDRIHPRAVICYGRIEKLLGEVPEHFYPYKPDLVAKVSPLYKYVRRDARLIPQDGPLVHLETPDGPRRELVEALA